MKTFFAWVGGALVVACGIRIASSSLNRDAFNYICRVVAQNFYRPSEELSTWAQGCKDLARNVSVFSGREQVVRQIREKLRELRVSHLAIFTPVQDERIAIGASTETGMRARLIDDAYVVYQVLKPSPAERAGIKVGDKIFGLDGREVVSVDQVQYGSGNFFVKRGDHDFVVDLEPESLIVETPPTLEALADGVGLLTISGFRGEHFGPTWREASAKLNDFNRIIIDVRGNPGGNFVAMLRAASPFFCTPKQIGLLSHPAVDGPHLEALFDDVDELKQIEIHEKYRSTGLKTFSGYPCYNKPVTVLIDAGTSSVSEVFAQAFLSRPRSRIWGSPSAGKVIVGVWYDIPFWPTGYTLSVPEAEVLGVDGQSLEGVGIAPDRDLFYELSDALKGVDTFIKFASARF